MEYICIDLGNKRCGIAVSKESIAFAREVVQRTDIIAYLKKYLSGVHLKECSIIVGLPHDLYGKDTIQLDRTKKFISKLQGIFLDIEIIGHDERFSSFVASEGMNEHRDDIAAQVILQSYIDSITT